MVRKFVFSAVIFAAFLVLEAAAFATSAAAKSLIDQVFTRRDYPSAPFGDCKGVDGPEREKFDECRLQVGFERERQRREQREKALEAAKLREEATWAWLNTQPTGDCAAIPESEYRKFFCLSEEDRQRQEISRVLERIKTARDGFEVRIRRLIDRELRLKAEAPEQPNPQEQRRLALVEDIETELGLIGAKRRLLENLSAGFGGEAAEERPERIYFGRARANAVIFDVRGADGRPRGRISKGELVLVLEYGLGDTLAGVISQDRGMGFVERTALSELK